MNNCNVCERQDRANKQPKSINLPALIAEFEREHEIYGWQSVDGIEYYRRRKRAVDYQEFTRWLIKRLKC